MRLMFEPSEHSNIQPNRPDEDLIYVTIQLLGGEIARQLYYEFPYPLPADAEDADLP